MTTTANVVGIVGFLVAIFGFSYTLYLLIQARRASLAPLTGWSDIPDTFGVEHLARIEAELPRLKRVIVIAHKVERPPGKLSDAVENNFRKGVSYLFLVSRSRAQAELWGYYGLFQKLAEIVLGPDGNPRRLIDIKQLSHEWEQVPYIFYQCEDESSHLSTFAVRGLQSLEGVADTYEVVDPLSAQALAQSALADAPGVIYSDKDSIFVSIPSATGGGEIQSHPSIEHTGTPAPVKASTKRT